ncbi:hypothetical protein [Spirosoma migulaei]
MTDKTIIHPYTPFFPPGPVSPDAVRKKTTNPLGEKPPRQPDWLLIWVSILFLLTILIAWLVDIPSIL